MSYELLQCDSRKLPLPDASVHQVAVSPPYWKQRDYEDDGGSMAGQIGPEDTWQEYIAGLVDCTREWVRVLRDDGTLWVNLGDKYATRYASRSEGTRLHASRGRDGRCGQNNTGAPEKSLLGLPWRYAFAVMDALGLTLRAEIIWSKPNARPESVGDRPVRSHEHLMMFSLGQRYYSALDLLREPHEMRPQRRPNGHKERQRMGVLPAQTWSTSQRDEPGTDGNPLGKLPRTVWEIPTVPLVVPPELGIEHYAAWPPELIRRIILAGCPAQVCSTCGEGRVPVTAYTGDEGRRPAGGGTYRAMREAGEWNTNLAEARLRLRGVIGYACSCTPRRAGGQRPEYLLDGWAPPPSAPGTVLDPMSGTGTTLMVADLLGRNAIGADLSGAYHRIAKWRIADPRQRALAAGEDPPAPVPAGQLSLDDFEPAQVS